ncbi:MAG: methylamine utilization protein [Sphingosinicella sp.]
MRRLLLSLLLFNASPALASSLAVEVRTIRGAPVPNAVVTLYPGGRAAPLASGRPSFQIAQRDLAFNPFVLVVPAGAQVAFPNYDDVRHHVYSFSPVRRFDLRLFAREQSRSVSFDRPGIVPIGCNIHDGMIAFIHVSDTALAAKTDGQGRVVIDGVPPGPLIARVWHPWLRAPGNRTEYHWTSPRGGRLAQAVNVDLRPAPRPASNY